MNENHTEKKKRSLTMSLKLNNDIEMLCEHLGLSVHAYMMAEIAKCVQRDILTLTTKSNLDNMLKEFQSLSERI